MTGELTLRGLVLPVSGTARFLVIKGAYPSYSGHVRDIYKTISFQNGDIKLWLLPIMSY